MTRKFTTKLRLRLRAAGRAIDKLISRPGIPPSEGYYRFPWF
jgi:hypothetical protein